MSAPGGLQEYEVTPVPVSMGLLEFIRTKGRIQIHGHHRKITCPRCGGLNLTEDTSEFTKLTCCNILVRVLND